MNVNNSEGSNFGVLIHGGAHIQKIKGSRANEITKFLVSSVASSFDILQRNGGAVNAVETAVAIMEDSGVFNAGAGSCLTIDKKMEMDASVMDGKELSAGSVGMVEGLRNPVKLAALVMKHTDHVMLVGEGVVELAKAFDMDVNPMKPNKQLLRKFKMLYEQKKRTSKRNRKGLRMPHDYGTVGAVAIDRDRNVASAVSTGGVWLKMHGRIGDSAVIGSGLYADNNLGAACATGDGEFMMRLCLCKYACDQMLSNGANSVSKKSISMLTKRFGKNTGGVITVDTAGRFGVATNTQSMPVALLTNKTREVKIALNCDERLPV